MTADDCVVCLNSVPAAKARAGDEPTGTPPKKPLLLTSEPANNKASDPDFGSPQRGILAQLLGKQASPAKLRTPRHYMGAAERATDNGGDDDDDDGNGVTSADVMRYLGHGVAASAPTTATATPSSTPPRNHHTLSRSVNGDDDGEEEKEDDDDDDDATSGGNFVPPYAPIRNTVIDHAMLHGRGASGALRRSPPPRHLSEVVDQAVQQASKLTPKEEAAWAACVPCSALPCCAVLAASVFVRGLMPFVV